MCIISPLNPVGLFGKLLRPWLMKVDVANTKIFGRLEAPWQYLAYSMKLSVRQPAAMILPLPVLPGFGDAALEFIDLSGYSEFFDDVDRAFPAMLSLQPESGGVSRAQGLPRLEVHRVGAFEASYVPSLKDFSRLDPRFRLPDKVWEALPMYREDGFAVFQLRRGQGQNIHPMAFRFRTKNLEQIFFPTVHVHDGEVHSREMFDHALYFQLPDDYSGPESDLQRVGQARYDALYPRFDLDASPFPGAGASYLPAERFVDIDRAEGLVKPGTWLFKHELRGLRANEDTRIPLSLDG